MMKKLILALAMATGMVNAATPAPAPELPVAADQDAQTVNGFKVWLKNNKPLISMAVLGALAVGYGYCAYKSEAFSADATDRKIAWLGEVLLAPLFATYEQSRIAGNATLDLAATGCEHVADHKYKYISGSVALAAALADLLREESVIKSTCRSVFTDAKKAKAEVNAEVAA